MERLNKFQAEERIRNVIPCTQFLGKQDSETGCYPCPFCGQHRLYLDRFLNIWNCTGCFADGDVIDLYQKHTNLPRRTAMAELAAQVGVEIDNTALVIPEEGLPQQPESIEGFVHYRSECIVCLESSDEALAYLERRGISKDTAIDQFIGFDPCADPSQANHPTPRLIIPTSNTHYLACRIDGVKDFETLNPKGTREQPFNGKVLKNLSEGAVVFITHGVFNALSILEVGGNAVSFETEKGKQEMLALIRENPSKATFVLAFESTREGRERADLLADELRDIGAAFVRSSVNGDYQNANTHLVRNLEGFKAAIKRAKACAAQRPDNVNFYLRNVMYEDVKKFRAEIKTGYPTFDESTGGLYTGLYVLAAISSLGKTTFALQMAEQIAKAGQEVLFFSLEQSRFELVSKGLARRTVGSQGQGRERALSSITIRKELFSAEWQREKLEIAKERYVQELGERFSIIEGNFGCDVEFITDYVTRYMKQTGERPVVFVDYLQVIQPNENTKFRTAKDSMDETVTALKRLSRDKELTIFVISSVNRANYLSPISFESLKESGSIEYTADVVLGLQLQCLHDAVFESTNITEKREAINAAKSAIPRRVELTCLKNRFGRVGDAITFNYFPQCDLYVDTGTAELDAPPSLVPKQGREKRRI